MYDGVRQCLGEWRRLSLSSSSSSLLLNTFIILFHFNSCIHKTKWISTFPLFVTKRLWLTLLLLLLFPYRVAYALVWFDSPEKKTNKRKTIKGTLLTHSLRVDLYVSYDCNCSNVCRMCGFLFLLLLFVSQGNRQTLEISPNGYGPHCGSCLGFAFNFLPHSHMVHMA